MLASLAGWLRPGTPVAAGASPPPVICTYDGPHDIHHIIPREYGGTNDFNNLVPVLRTVHQQEFNPWWMNYGG
jgi:5-methylcytosine-specific restriction endonuclease McrA